MQKSAFSRTMQQLKEGKMPMIYLAGPKTSARKGVGTIARAEIVMRRPGSLTELERDEKDICSRTGCTPEKLRYGLPLGNQAKWEFSRKDVVGVLNGDVDPYELSSRKSIEPDAKE